jgi:signal transduction histidine kinase
VLSFLGKGSKLIVIFILTVLVSGSILTYLSITHISNYKELLEKKISEEERDLTKRFASDFQIKLESLTLNFSDYLKNNHLPDLNGLKSFDSIKELINYIVIDSNGSFLRPYFINDNLASVQVKSTRTYSDRLRDAQNNEFIAKDFKSAELFYLKTLKAAESKSDSVRIYNSMARLYIKMDLEQKAIDAYQIILTKFNSISNSSGFPYAYFSVNKLLKISNPSNIEQVQKLLISFLNGLIAGTIPYNDSSVELLDLIIAWRQKNQDTINNKTFEELIEQNKNSLLLINNYKIPIEKVLKEKNDKLGKDQPIDFLHLKPLSNSTDELMLFFKYQPNAMGFVIGLNPLFMIVLQSQQMNNLKFEYKIKLIEKNASNYLSNSNLITLTEFSPHFENSLIRVSLENENIIDESVFKRKIIYGVGLFLFLGTMVFGLYLLIQDVNREKRMNKLRANFVSNVTHELKTPLTSIHMFAEALNMGKDKLDSRQIKYTNIIVKESEKLKRMINNILEFSRKENNKLSYKLKRSNLTNIVNSSLKEMDYFLQINKIKVNSAIENNIFANVHEEGIKQALSNLISNAVKYSSTNKKLNVRLFRSASEIFIEVEDFGIGIPQEKLELIFEKFYRVNSSENETTSGTGLGLTVTKAIIEEQHGKLLVESTVGKGSKFTIVLNTA